EGAVFLKAKLSRANLTMADLRHCDLFGAELAGAILTGAKLFGIEAVADRLADAIVEWADFSPEGSGQLEVNGADLAEYDRRVKDGFSGTSGTLLNQPKRYFGKGDVLRHATLEFSEKSEVEIQSYLEKCTIALAAGTKLTVGSNAVLVGCQIIGCGEIVV